MEMREQIIVNFLNSGLTQSNDNVFSDVLTGDAVYTDYLGYVYSGIVEIRDWFRGFNKKVNISKWDVMQFIHQGHATVIEWKFIYEQEGQNKEFEGLFLIKFNKHNYITEVKEYISEIDKDGQALYV